MYDSWKTYLIECGKDFNNLSGSTSALALYFQYLTTKASDAMVTSHVIASPRYKLCPRTTLNMNKECLDARDPFATPSKSRPQIYWRSPRSSGPFGWFGRRGGGEALEEEEEGLGEEKDDEVEEDGDEDSENKSDDANDHEVASPESAVKSDTLVPHDLISIIYPDTEDEQTPTQMDRTTPNRRLHVFQGRHGIYLIFAEYGQDFLDYLKGNGGHDAYMTMHEYGPWITMSWKQMETPP